MLFHREPWEIYCNYKRPISPIFKIVFTAFLTGFSLVMGIGLASLIIR